MAALVAALSACGAGGTAEGLTVGNGFDHYEAGAPIERGGSASGNYLAGRHAQARGDAFSAAEYYGAALAIEADRIDLLGRGLLYKTMSGDIPTAVEMAARLSADDLTDPLPALVLAVRDVGQGRFAEAAERVGRLPKRGITVFMEPLLTAWTEAAQGRTDAALAELAPLATDGGLTALHDLHAALINQAAGRHAAAITAYESAISSDNGLSLRVAELLGALHERLGDFDAALEVYGRYRLQHPASALIEPIEERARKAEPRADVAFTPAEGIAEALFGIASSFRQQNATDTALAFVRLALHLRPDFPIAQILLADILEAMGRPREAIAAYEAIDPASPFAWSARLRISANLDGLGQIDEAVAILKDMAAQRPRQTEPLIQLGDLLRAREQFTQAVDAYDQAFARMDEGGDVSWALHYTRGVALERAKDWDRAEADFLRALEIEPDQPYVLNYLGYSWVEMGKNIDQAREMIERAVRLRPNDGYIVDSLGWVLYRIGDLEGAVKHLEKAVELRPDDPVINDHLGDVYWRVGRTLEARFQWRRALSLKPEPDQADTIRRKLEKGLDQD